VIELWFLARFRPSISPLPTANLQYFSIPSNSRTNLDPWYRPLYALVKDQLRANRCVVIDRHTFPDILME
jgi:hypothetical protein